MMPIGILLCQAAILCFFTSSFKVEAGQRGARWGSKLKFPEIIDIDNYQLGSGIGQGDDDNFDEWSGFEDGSAEEPSWSVSECLRLQSAVLGQHKIGAYVPRCTASGEFALVQCHGSTGECWCANKYGQQVPGTRLRAPDSPDCSNVDRQKAISGKTGNFIPQSTFAPFTSSYPRTVVIRPKDDVQNKIDNMPPYGHYDFSPPEIDSNEVEQPQTRRLIRSQITGQPGILAGIIGAAVICLLCLVLLIMFIVYRLRRKHNYDAYPGGKSKMAPILNYAAADVHGAYA